eukprot:TRINITY_DN42516_c0_g1_i3.p1 TRINITY_DN42516_c0_g1~~TRINITY_DN42516_c0_g1_i3.p1  ORF type:complete len:1248 (+),score=378.56 TRINITY_DN42516_c0_g1_i3:90-3746(+)
MQPAALGHRTNVSPRRRRLAEGGAGSGVVHDYWATGSPRQQQQAACAAGAFSPLPLAEAEACYGAAAAAVAEPPFDEKVDWVYGAMNDGSPWGAQHFRSSLRHSGLDFSGETADELLAQISTGTSGLVGPGDWRRFCARYPTLLEALWRFLCAAQDELTFADTVAAHRDSREGVEQREGEARRDAERCRKLAEELEAALRAAEAAAAEQEGRLRQVQGEADAHTGTVAQLQRQRDSAARGRRGAQRRLQDLAREAAATAAAERRAAIDAGRRSAAHRAQQRHGEADAEQRRAAQHEALALAAETRMAAANELSAALAPVEEARKGLSQASAECDAERDGVAEAQRALAAAEARMGRALREREARERELRSAMPAFEEVSRRQVERSVWRGGAIGSRAQLFSGGDEVMAHPAMGELTLAGEGWRLPQGMTATVVDCDADGNPRLRNAQGQLTRGFVPVLLLRPARALAVGDTVEPARGSLSVSFPGESCALAAGDNALVVATDSAGGVRLRLPSGRETRGFVPAEQLRLAAPPLAVGDLILPQCGGADLILDDGRWRLGAGEQAVVCDVDEGGNPRLRTVAGGAVTSGFVPRQYVQVANALIAMGDRVRPNCGGGALCVPDDGWTLGRCDEATVAEVDPAGNCRLRSADGRVTSVFVPRALLQPAPLVDEGDRVVPSGGTVSVPGEDWVLREGEVAEVVSVDPQGRVRLRLPNGLLANSSVHQRLLRPAPPVLRIGDRVRAQCNGGDLVLESGRWRLHAADEAVVCEVDPAGNPRLRAADGAVTGGFVPKQYVSPVAGPEGDLDEEHDYVVHPGGGVEGIGSVVVDRRGVAVQTTVSRRQQQSARRSESADDPLAALSRHDENLTRAEDQLLPAKQRQTELLAALRQAEAAARAAQQGCSDLRSDHEEREARRRTAEQELETAQRLLQAHDARLAELAQQAAAAAERRRRAAERERALVEQELRLREQRDALEAKEARLLRERDAFRGEFPVVSPRGGRASVSFARLNSASPVPLHHRPGTVESQSPLPQSPSIALQHQQSSARMSGTSASDAAPVRPGDFVVPTWGARLRFEEDGWELRPGEEAEVVAVDGEGNPRLQNPSGAVTVRFVDRACIRHAPAPPRCEVGMFVAGNNGDSDLYFEEENWCLLVTDTAEVVAVDADGNPRLRNPHGQVTQGYVDRRFLRPCTEDRAGRVPSGGCGGARFPVGRLSPRRSTARR